MSGPTIAGTTHDAASNEKALGRRFSGKARAMSTYVATMSAPPPNPWMPRATMSTGIDQATPATTAPPAKTQRPTHIARRGPSRSLHVPDTTIPTSEQATYELNAQA